MSARENRVNPSTSRPADLVVDGWRRGVHYTQGAEYVCSIDVAGELPRLLVEPRGIGASGREAVGVRQPFGLPELDGPLVATSTGLDFPKALVRRPDVRDGWLAAARALRFVELSAPVVGQTGLVVSVARTAAEPGLDLAAVVLRALDDLLARKTVFADASLAKIAETRVEPSAEVLAGLVAQLDAMTSWVGGHAARVGDAVEARLVLTEAGVEMSGTLRVAWRDETATIVDATLDAALPGVPWAPLHLTPQASLVDRIRAIAETRVGDEAIDAAFVTTGDPRHATLLGPSRDVVLRRVMDKARFELSENRLRVLVPPAPRVGDELTSLCADLLEIWRRVTIARMGHPLVELPID